MTNPGQRRSLISATGLSVTKAAGMVAFLSLLAFPSAQARFKVLHAFSGKADGGRPFAAVIRDASGNLYGTTLWGGNLTCNSGNGCGVVYKLTSAGKETVLHRFAGGKDGAYPSAALIMDAQGNLYGTTTAGGNSGCFSQGCGIVFKIDTLGKETVFHRFTGGKDGGEPSSALIMDKLGNFYGTATIGGNLTCSLSSGGCGVVYKLTNAGKETVLHSFKGTDGAFPGVDSLAMDTNGNFYGATHGGGDATCNCGVVFKLTGAGKETVLHTFLGGTTDGSYPLSGVTLYKGTLYGTAALSGANNKGVLFTIKNPSASEQPAATFGLLHSFGGGTDGATPAATVAFDAQGNLFGTTEVGGTLGYGTLYKVDTTGKESVLYNLNYSIDGGVPLAPVTIVKVKALQPPPDVFEWLFCMAEGGTTKGGPASGTVGYVSGH
jgi:uncharacterized repeat protein (TIGR03803 family)